MDRGGSGWERRRVIEKRRFTSGSREGSLRVVGDGEVYLGTGKRLTTASREWEGGEERGDTSTVSTTKLSLVKLPPDNIFHAFRDLFRLSIYWSYWELRSRVTFWGGVDARRGKKGEDRRENEIYLNRVLIMRKWDRWKRRDWGRERNYFNDCFDHCNIVWT